MVRAVMMRVMNRTRLFVFLFIIAFLFVGCDEGQQTSKRAKTEGIKISDLESFGKREMPPEIQFRIYTFLLSEQMLTKSDNIFEMLDKDSLTFVNAEAFKANGLAVGYSKGGSWGELGERLRQAGAVGVKETAMMVYDDKGEDLTFGTLNRAATIDYFTSEDDSFRTTISPGQLAWRIVAVPIEDKPRTAEVNIVAISKPDITMVAEAFRTKRKTKTIIYNVSGIELEMNPGDFLVLGPEKYDPDLNLDTLSLTASGEFELLEGDPNDVANADAGKMTLGKLLLKIEDKPSVRFFVVICVRTGN
jgi:hypothetical protein